MSQFRFTTGPKLLVDFGNMIIDQIQAEAWKPGATMRKGGTLFDVIATAAGGGPTAWPWKVYNTTTGTTGQVQINGGDGFVATLNGVVAKVNGNPVDELISGVYPQLSVTASGVIYAYIQPTTPGDISAGLAYLDIYADTSEPSDDTSTPQGYIYVLIATISDYTNDGSKVSFTVNNAINYGYSRIIYCGDVLQIY